MTSAWTVTFSDSIDSLPQLWASSRLRPAGAAEVRHVGHDLDRELVAADAVVVELGLHAGLVDEVLRRAAAEDDRRGRRPANHDVGRLDDVADHVDRRRRSGRDAGPATRPCQSTSRRSPGRRSARWRGYAAVRMPSMPRLVPQVLAEPVQELPRRVRPPLELEHERGDPLVVLAELVFARQRVVDAIDPLGGQRGVVERRRADEVPAAARLVQVVVQVGARRDEAVDVALLDQMRDDQPHAAGRQRAGGAQEDRRVAGEHLLPDAARRPRGCAPETRSAPCARARRRPRDPASTTNGSTGLRRKRDLRRLMRASFYRAIATDAATRSSEKQSRRSARARCRRATAARRRYSSCTRG